jgi:cell division protein FtsA
MRDMLRKLKALKGGGKKGDDGPTHVVALDIGTENVKALVGRIAGDELEIVGVGRAHQEQADMQAGAIADIAGVVRNCDAALAQAETQSGVNVRDAVIGIAGELVKGTTTTVKFARKDPQKSLDMPELEKIIRLVQQRAETKAKQQLAWELGGKDVEIRLVNSALVGITIDGYPISNPIGFQGRDVIVQLYTAFAPLIHIGALERTAHELDLELLAVAAEPFAVARAVIGNDPAANMSAILMDVGGGTTDIAVVNEGGVEGTKMFGIGGRAFTKSIERALGVEFGQAESLKLAIGSTRIPQHKQSQIHNALESTLDVWINGVELALAEFDNVDHLPSRILLCGGGSSLEMLQARLADSTWYTALPFTRKPQIHLIQPSLVSGIRDMSGAADDHTYITAMGLLRVGLDTVQQQNPSSLTGSIRERINKILSV